MPYSHCAERRPGQAREQMGCIKICGSFNTKLKPRRGGRALLSPIVLVSVPVPVQVPVPLSMNTSWTIKEQSSDNAFASNIVVPEMFHESIVWCKLHHWDGSLFFCSLQGERRWSEHPGFNEHTSRLPWLRELRDGQRGEYCSKVIYPVLDRVPTWPGKPGKMRVHLENLEISLNFKKFNKYHGKMIWNLEKLGGY